MGRNGKTLLWTGIVIVAAAVILTVSMWLLFQNPRTGPAPMEDMTGPGLDHLDGPVSQQALSEKIGQYTHITKDENGVKVLLFSREQQIALNQKRKKGHLRLSYEEIIYIINDSIRLYQECDQIQYGTYTVQCMKEDQILTERMGKKMLSQIYGIIRYRLSMLDSRTGDQALYLSDTGTKEKPETPYFSFGGSSFQIVLYAQGDQITSGVYSERTVFPTWELTSQLSANLDSQAYRWGSFEQWLAWGEAYPEAYEQLIRDCQIDEQEVIYYGYGDGEFYFHPFESFYQGWVDSEVALESVRQIAYQPGRDPLQEFMNNRKLFSQKDYFTVSKRTGQELPLLVQLIRYYGITEEQLLSYVAWYTNKPDWDGKYPLAQLSVLVSEADALIKQSLRGEHTVYSEGRIYNFDQVVHTAPPEVLLPTYRDRIRNMSEMEGYRFVGLDFDHCNWNFWPEYTSVYMEEPTIGRILLSRQWLWKIKVRCEDVFPEHAWRWNSFAEWVTWKEQFGEEYAACVKYIDKEKVTVFPSDARYNNWLDSGMTFEIIDQVLYMQKSPADVYLTQHGKYGEGELPLFVQMVRYYQIPRELLEAYDEWNDANPNLGKHMYRVCTPENLDVIYSEDDGRIIEYFSNKED